MCLSSGVLPFSPGILPSESQVCCLHPSCLSVDLTLSSACSCLPGFFQGTRKTFFYSIKTSLCSQPHPQPIIAQYFYFYPEPAISTNTHMGAQWLLQGPKQVMLCGKGWIKPSQFKETSLVMTWRWKPGIKSPVERVWGKQTWTYF